MVAPLSARFAHQIQHLGGVGDENNLLGRVFHERIEQCHCYSKLARRPTFLRIFVDCIPEISPIF